MTKQAAQGLGILYIVYALFMIGIPGLLLSLAAGLVVMGMQNSFELAVAATILVGLLYKVIPFRKTREGFQTVSAADVTQRINQMKNNSMHSTPPVGYDKGNAPQTGLGPQGVLASPFAEGFASVYNGLPNSSLAEGFANPDDSKDGERADKAKSANSGPGSADIKNEVKEEALPAKPIAKAVEKASTEKKADGFKGSSDGLFRLGEMPNEASGGPHIDTSSTVLSAISSLKPDQIKNMTDDTRKLLDTQKSLLGMLETMKPMITDGQELLSSFNNMFGKQGGGFKLGA